MIRFPLIASIALGLVTAKADDDLPTRLQNVSVTVHADDAQGSGTLITRDKINYVLTAGHVVEGNRSVTEVSGDGRGRFQTRFTPLKIVREIYTSDQRSVGQTSVEAEVIAYSSVDYGQDLALLKLRSSISTDSAVLAKETASPRVGTALIHVGSLLGQEGSNSVATGEISQLGRVFDDKVFDQTSCTAYPGSSGGGIFLRSNGELIGVLTLGMSTGDNFHFYVPVRRIRQWAKVHGVEFIFDPAAKPDLSKVKLEEAEPLPEKGVPFKLFKFGLKKMWLAKTPVPTSP